jgi:beta-ureidopropionase
LNSGTTHYDASPFITSEGEIAGISKMVHIAQLPLFYEQDYYEPSDSGFEVYDTPFGKVGIVICFDRHFPESIRTCAVMGARLIVIPTANTTAEPLDLFEAEIRVAAMQNAVYIAMCNRVGVEGDMEFAGESLVVGPDGNVVAKADGSEQLLLGDIDFSKIDNARKKRPYISLRRPDTYR